ncbi:hypothetical protein [Paraburkholderia humisilvae]|uniref:hypothetical protein n=1 Tax=Paraburkholderia humisilvae TaxID=627669 RepID=UPI001583CB50|nr:hypothetical protein [Paraburkholderia humisilvae]
MSSRQFGQQRVGQTPPVGALATHISTLKPAGGDDRAELIRDVVDGLMRLRNSALRFVLLFVGSEDASRRDEYSAAPLPRLLTVLANAAHAAQFDRMRELKRTIRDARALEKTRDAVFSESFSNNAVALRGAAAELERVDAILVGLCVEHVLERQLATPVDAARVAAVVHARPAHAVAQALSDEVSVSGR